MIVDFLHNYRVWVSHCIFSFILSRMSFLWGNYRWHEMDSTCSFSSIILVLYFGKNGNIHLDLPKWFTEWFYCTFLLTCCFQLFLRVFMWEFPELAKSFLHVCTFFHLDWSDLTGVSIQQLTDLCFMDFSCFILLLIIYSNLAVWPHKVLFLFELSLMILLFSNRN